MKGKAVSIVKTDKDGYLISIRNPAKLTNNQIRNDLSSLIIKRKRAEEALKQNKNIGGISIFQNSGKDPLNPPQDDETVEASLFYRDIAIMRNINDQIQVLSVILFNSTFEKRQNHPVWYTISYLQANVKARIGVGRIIHFLFLYDMAKIRSENDQNKGTKQRLKDYEDINFFEDQIKDLKLLSERDVCYQYCLRICYYLQKIYGIEILKMNTYFTADDDGVLWFTYASDISVRFKNSRPNPQVLKQMGYISEEEERNMHDVSHSTDPHLNLSRDFLNKPYKASKKMYNIMSDYYKEIKERLGVLDVCDNEDDILNDPIPMNERFPKCVMK